MSDYYIGEIFIGTYPPEAVEWCDANDCGMVQIADDEHGLHQFQIQKNTQPTAAERKEIFLKSFFKVGELPIANNETCYYRRVPKGYTSAIESINTAFNICSRLGGLPADTLIFYPEPNFKIAEQCTEAWLVAHQIKLPAMTAAQFDELYIAFVTAWNKEEH